MTDLALPVGLLVELGPVLLLGIAWLTVHLARHGRARWAAARAHAPRRGPARAAE